MGKKGKKAQAGKPKKLAPKDIGKPLDALVVKLEKELEGADLFAPLRPTEDCPICCVPLSRIEAQIDYKACCGKSICVGCAGENKEFIDQQKGDNSGEGGKKYEVYVCPFCRGVEPQSGEECVRQLEMKAEKSDPKALCLLGQHFESGTTPCNTTSGVLREKVIRGDVLRGIDCWIRATELGSARACGLISACY